MKVLIEMAPEHYDGFLSKCHDHWLPAYAVLKDGVLVRQGDRHQVDIVCELHQARNLLLVARSMHSPAVEDIKRALNFAEEK